MNFADRHIGPSGEQTQQMLEAIGAGSLEELTAQAVPGDILLKEDLALSSAMSEGEYLDHLKGIAAGNKPFR